MQFEYGLLMSRNYGFIAVLMFTRKGEVLTFDFPSDKTHKGNFNEVVNEALLGKTFERGESLHTEMKLAHIEGKPWLKGYFVDTGPFPEITMQSDLLDHPLDMLVTDAQDIFFPDFKELAKGAPDYGDEAMEEHLRDKLNRHVKNGLFNYARCVHLLKERQKPGQDISKINKELIERKTETLF